LILTRYVANRTGLLIVDPFNDFLSSNGKLWPRIEAATEPSHLVGNLRTLIETARQVGVIVMYLPHRRWREGDFDGWRHPTPWQLTIDREALFADGTWGGDWHPELVPQPGDVIIQEHWGQNGFFNTDLDLQLKQHRLDSIIVAGMAANLCVAATARYGAELGYHVTLVRDATAALDGMTATPLEDSVRTFAHSILSTAEIIGALGVA
jgi:nicotinamidase-related amidase